MGNQELRQMETNHIKRREQQLSLVKTLAAFSDEDAYIHMSARELAKQAIVSTFDKKKDIRVMMPACALSDENKGVPTSLAKLVADNQKPLGYKLDTHEYPGGNWCLLTLTFSEA